MSVTRSLACAAVLALYAVPLCAQPQPESPEIAIHGIRPRRDPNELKLSAEQARRQAGTQDDPVKIIEDLPGLARAGFGADQLVLWGAAPEDTRVYVDGVEIPQLFHGSGLRSTVNGDLLQSVALSPGAFGADYGRAIGGMVRLETRELLSDGYHATLDASTLDASALVSAPVGERVRVALAARYGLLDRTLSAVDAPDVGEFFAVPRYHDYQAKVRLALRERESLEAVLLGSSDDLSRTAANADPARALSVSTSSSFERVYLRYRRVYDDGSSAEVVPWFGRDEAQYSARFASNPAELEQSTWRWGLRAEHRSRVASQVTLRLGFDAASSQARLERTGSLNIPAREGDLSVFGQPPGDDTNSDHWQATVLDAAPYAALDWDAGPLTLTPGL
ncbi:MAG TPA: TonB-dependent receptor, partial [Polyangiaceae bacterium]